MSKSTESILSISRDLLLNRNVRVIAITSLISGVYIGMLNTVLQPFTLSLGLGLTSLGILQALGNRFSGITASLIQPFAGHYADVFGRKVVIVVGSAATIVSMVLFLIAAFTQSWVVLTTAYILYGISMLSSPASQAVVAESVSLEPTKMDVAFSAVFLFGSIPGAVMSFVAGVLADTIGYFVVFVIAVILESVDLFLFVRELRETKALGKATESAVGRNSFSFRSAIRLPKGFFGFFATFAMDSFAFGISITIIYGMLVERFRYSNTDIGLSRDGLRRDDSCSVSGDEAACTSRSQEISRVIRTLWIRADDRMVAFRLYSSFCSAISRFRNLNRHLGTRATIHAHDAFSFWREGDPGGEASSIPRPYLVPRADHWRPSLPNLWLLCPTPRERGGHYPDVGDDSQTITRWTSVRPSEDSNHFFRSQT